MALFNQSVNWTLLNAGHLDDECPQPEQHKHLTTERRWVRHG